jgi:hypothetical protein
MKRPYSFISAATVLALLVLTLLLLAPAPSACQQPVFLEGTVIESLPSQSTLVIRVNQGLTARILLGSFGPWHPHSILPGDRVRVETDPASGKSRLTDVQGGYFSGELLFVSPAKLITSEGRQVFLSPEAVIIKNGRKAEVGDLQPGMRVFLRVDPGTSLAGWVEAVDLKAPVDTDGGLKVTGVQGPPKNASFRQGQPLDLSISGTPGSRVSFHVTGICRDVPMAESRPGLYRGSFPFKREDVRQARLIIRMEKGGGELVRLGPSSFDVAISPPVIEAVSPRPGERIRGKSAMVFALLSSQGSLIDGEASTVFLDGKPLGEGLWKNVEHVKADLPAGLKPGAHVIKVVARDTAGNTASRQWEFTFAPAP